MTRKYTNRRYLDALEKKILVFDGAMGTSLQTQNLTAEHFGGEKLNGCNDYLVISYQQAVETVHRSFLEVGVELAVELIQKIKPWAQGIYVMPQFNRYDMVAEIIEAIK